MGEGPLRTNYGVAGNVSVALSSVLVSFFSAQPRRVSLSLWISGFVTHAGACGGWFGFGETTKV